MKKSASRSRSGSGLYARSWMGSLLLHGLLVAGAALLLSDLRLAPEPEPFRWEVAMVDSMDAAETASAQSPGPGEAREVLDASPNAPPAPSRPVSTDRIKPARPATTSPVKQVRQSRQVSPAAAPGRSRGALSGSRPATNVAQPGPMAKTVQEVRPEPPAEKPAGAQGAGDPPAESATAPRSSDSASAEAVPAPQPPATKPDYSWLAQALWSRVHALKRYPLEARLNRLEGQVVLRIVIQEDGRLLDAEVVKTSGHAVLDDSALAVVKSASPLTLTHPLGRSQVVVQVPITYRLNQR